MNTTLILQEICLLINVVICFGIPIIGTMVMTKKGCAPMRPFLFGMASFLVGQVVLFPITTMFGAVGLLKENTAVSACLYGVCSALIVEAVRYLFLKLSAKKQEDAWDGMAFGLGQGGLEAVLLVGLADEATMIALAQGADTAAQANGGTVLLGGAERIFSIAFQVGVSMLLWYGLRTNEWKKNLILVMLLHIGLNMGAAVLSNVLQVESVFTALFTGIYGFCVLAAALSREKKRMDEEKASPVVKKKKKK
ncbi:MAG: YhfC family glutamic-type intramembrane protease [Lachnospiraceae bacterium]